MANRKGMRDLTSAISLPDDGLREFAVWAEWHEDKRETVIRKILPLDHADSKLRGYPTCDGVIRAKDEMDVYRFIKKMDEER